MFFFGWRLASFGHDPVQMFEIFERNLGITAPAGDYSGGAWNSAHHDGEATGFTAW